MMKQPPTFIEFAGEWVRRSAINRFWSSGNRVYVCVCGGTVEESCDNERLATNRELELKHLLSEVIE